MTKTPDRTTAHHDHLIDARLKISALWTAMLFIFAYVDLFGLYRPDVRGDIDSGKAGVFAINQTFLFLATLYIVIASLMIYLTLVMGPSLNRRVNIVVATLYLVTIAGGAIGEWSYYILGSVIEALLLALIVHHAWTGLTRLEPAHTTSLRRPGAGRQIQTGPSPAK